MVKAHGAAFWVTTALLGLLLPTPIAIAVVAARLRGAARARAAGATPAG